MLTNEELTTRLRTLSEQVPEGEWDPGDHDRTLMDGRTGEPVGVTTEPETALVCLLWNHVPQILEALEQVAGSEVSE